MEEEAKLCFSFRPSLLKYEPLLVLPLVEAKAALLLELDADIEGPVLGATNAFTNACVKA
jgi:hypothetical protein